MDAPLWSEGVSEFAHEREALAFVRHLLPNHEPYRAWANVEFIADDGTVNEVDLLVVSPRGFFLVEIKSFPGKLFGDTQQWRNVRPDGRERTFEHPLILANRKAKRLKSLLGRQPAFRNERPPFVTALVFLSSPELQCRLYAVGRTGVTGRDRSPNDPVPAPVPEGGFEPLPGVVATLKNPEAGGQRAHEVNKPLSRRIAEAITQAGLQPINRGRKVGDWELGELIDEGPGWQDFLATRPNPAATRRVRVYLSGAATSEDEERRLRREAEREFKLLESLRHDHIADVKDFVQAERGPALLFDRVDGETRLDLWAAEHLDALSIDQRIELVRQLAEALRHAHANRVTHRALSARSVLVSPTGDGQLPRLVIGHWQAGARELATRLTRHAPESTVFGEDLAERLESDEQVYLAPEMFAVDDADPVALDVFSLGSLTYLLLTGRPPAADVAARDATLHEFGGLPVAAAVDGVPDALELFVASATSPIPAERESTGELLKLLDAALDELTRPDDDAVAPELIGVDPLSAHQGAVLDGGWKVLRRLGSGSTAVALLCQREGAVDPEVLKVCKDEDDADRLLDEARTLERLRHATVVELFGVEQIGGRTALRLAPAGDVDDQMGMTLADRLAAQGRVGLDLLERFGDDLLEAVGYLESEGVAHRDIKPDNLGVRKRRGDGTLHLVLFDLSLSRTADTSIGAGTPGYLDPFLAERPGKRWDPSADRYSVAATLLDMATGVRPKWGDGRTDPLHLPDETPSLDLELFDPGVREPMAAFFTRALHRNPARRYDTSDQMRQAWRAVFSGARRGVSSIDDRVDDDALDLLAASAGPSTPMAEVGLSGLAVSALEHRGVNTVGALLAMSVVDWNRAPGVGRRVRREVLEAITRLREFVEVEPDADDALASIDRLATLVLPKSEDQHALSLLLGLGGQSTLGQDTTVTTVWTATNEVRSAFGLDRTEYEALIARARARWSRLPPMTQVRKDVVSLLERSGGVLPGDEIAEALLTQRGSTAVGSVRLVQARAVVRAALETESGLAKDRFSWRRLAGGNSVVVALRSDELDAEELADYASHLGVVADQLASAEQLPSADAVRERLRAVPAPAGLEPLPDFRLARLAAAASSTAAVSSRLEIYPRDLEPERALRLSRAALLGAGTLSETEVRTRVRTRLPAAKPLPLRPELDHLLDRVLGLQWFDAGVGASGVVQPEGFRVPPSTAGAPSTAFGPSGHRFRTGTVASVPDADRLAAVETHERLERHARNGGYLVVTVPPRWQQRAVTELASYGASVVDLDAWVVGAIRHHAQSRGIKWDQAIVATDAAGPSGERWDRLHTVVADALAPLADELLAAEHVLLTHPGLLVRFGRLGLLDELRERTRQPCPGQVLRTLWVLVPADDPVARPKLAGKAIPVTTAAEHLAAPEPWLENLHHTEGGPS